MKVLGSGFIQSFMMPYMTGTILNQAKLEKSPLVQKVFDMDKELDLQDFDALVTSDDYFKDTGTIFDIGGIEHRKVFWHEFIDFINDQQRISDYNDQKFVFRTLPDAKTGIFSQVARDNIFKFCMRVVKAVEESEIKRLIDVRESNGEISKEAAAQDRVNLAKGKLLLAKGADGKDVYLSEDEIKNALGDVTRRAELLKKLQIRKDSNGVYIFLINPVGNGDGSTLREVQAAIWQNQKIRVEQQLAELGLDARNLQIDAYGVLRGNLKDSSGTETIVEVNLDQPGQRRYRLTMGDNSSEQIWLTDSEMQNFFSYEQKTIVEVFEVKKMEETRESNDIPARKIIPNIPTAEQQKAAIESTMEVARRSKAGLNMNLPKGNPQEEEQQQGSAHIGIKKDKTTDISYSDEGSTLRTGVRDIKAEFYSRKKGYLANEDESFAREGGPDTSQSQETNQPKQKQEKNRIFTVLKVLGWSFGGLAGSMVGFTMFI
ncbi:hypothetical protein KKD70_04295 [Patescibacteria group bacterium]|nr:hypothetical protein [Patescibacteria group bacterium]